MWLTQVQRPLDIPDGMSNGHGTGGREKGRTSVTPHTSMAMAPRPLQYAFRRAFRAPQRIVAPPELA